MGNGKKNSRPESAPESARGHKKAYRTSWEFEGKRLLYSARLHDLSLTIKTAEKGRT